MKHRWGEPARPDIHTTRRTCIQCGLVKISRHEPENDPQHWTEWERGGARVRNDKTPPCEGGVEIISRTGFKVGDVNVSFTVGRIGGKR